MATRGFTVLSDAARDVRHALRLLARAPAFTLLAVITLGLGVGANTAIFSVVNALLMRPLPYPNPERLVFLDGTFSRPEGNTNFQLSYPEFADLVSARSFAAVAPWTTGYGLALEGTEGASRLQANFVGRSYFELLGARPILGRVFAADDHHLGDDDRMVAIVTEAVWRQHFGGNAAIVGRQVRLQGRPFTIVGVMPSSFDDAARAYSEAIDVWVPIERAPVLVGGIDLRARGGRLVWGFARLADGVERSEAEAELTTISRQLSAEYPQTNAAFTIHAAPLADSFFRDARRPLWMLLGGSWFVLLIGCANVANLLLVRSTGRMREFAVRRAIGASRSRVIRQLLAESLVLALLGAVAGVMVALWLTPALVAASGLTLPRFADVRVDRSVLGATLATAIVCGLVFGLAPIWRAYRMNARDGVSAGGSRASARSGVALWVAGIEVTAAFVLASGALLMLQSFSTLARTGLAFRTEHLLTVRLELPQNRYNSPGVRAQFGERVRQQLGALPGVQSAILWGPSMFAHSTWISFVSPADRVVADNERTMLWRHSTNPGGLRDLGIALQSGRDFAATDTLDAPLVAILSEASARRLWPGQDPIGRQLRTSASGTAALVTIVGVAADARHRGRFSFSEGAAADEPQLDLYLPYAQRPNALVTIGLRTVGDPASMTRAVATAIAAIDPTIPLYDIAPLDDRLRLEERSVKFATLLLTLYGGLALVLAAIGVYGVLAAGVASRVRELGIRAALGAEPRRLQAAVMRQGVTVAAIAILLGVGITSLLTSTTRALLFQTTPADGRVLGGAAALLIVVAAAASVIPARRASRVELLSVLKTD